jgi:hypothetical protein
VHFAHGLCELHDFRSTTPEDLVGVFATAATNVAQVGTGLWLLGRRADPRYRTSEQERNTMFICPEHAQIFARAGWDRQRIQEAMYKAARIPLRTMMLNKERQAMRASHPELSWLHDHPELPVPVVEDPAASRSPWSAAPPARAPTSMAPASPSPCPWRMREPVARRVAIP